MPAAWMSSQPRIRRSVSLCKSSPSCMEGVGESRSSGMSEWSIVSDTSEYNRSPISIPAGGAGGGGGGGGAEESGAPAAAGET
ncbi:hypothetical protein E2320_009077 [Naja naja]|nr:hypothetical protein E2320_009077 [Naja naja]